MEAVIKIFSFFKNQRLLVVEFCWKMSCGFLYQYTLPITTNF